MIPDRAISRQVLDYCGTLRTGGVCILGWSIQGAIL